MTLDSHYYFLAALLLLFGGLMSLSYAVTRMFGPDETEDDDDWPDPPA